MECNYDLFTDEEIQMIVKQHLNLFLEPIKKVPMKYPQYSTLVSAKARKSLLVPKMLPGAATKLIRRHDSDYLFVMEKASELITSVFMKQINDLIENEVTAEEVCAFSDDEIVNLVDAYENKWNEKIEIDYFIVQLKLLGVTNIDERKNSILKACGYDVLAGGNSEDGIENSDAIGDALTEDKVISETINEGVTKKKNKVKKVTAEEKAAKNRAAVEAKEKAAKEKAEQEAKEKAEQEAKEKAAIILNEKIEKEMTEELTDDSLTNIKGTRDIMNGYIGVINIKTNYYNFTPIGKYDESGFYAYTERDLDELLPKSNKHNINFYYNIWDDSHVKFMADHFYENQVVFLKCDISDLEENRTSSGVLNDTGYKISAIESWNRGKIGPLNITGLYRLINLEYLLDDIETKKVIRIDSVGLVEGEKILVNMGNNYYAGPFTVKYSSQNDTLFIVMQAVEGKHFMYGYSTDDCIHVYIETSVDVENWIGYNSWTYYGIKNNAVAKARDIISDKDLLDSFCSSLEKVNGTDKSELNVDEIIDNTSSSLLIGTSIPEEIREARKARIKRILSDETSFKQLYVEASDIICDLLIKNKESLQIEQLFADLFSKKPELIDRMQGVRAVQSKMDSARAELEELEAKKSEIIADIRNIQESKNDITNHINSVDEKLSKEIEGKKAELIELLNKLKVADDVSELQERIDKLKNEASYYDNHKLHLMNDAKNLESKFVELVNGYSEKMADITFDGFMSSKMLQAASNWETKNKNEELIQKAFQINSIESDEMSNEELVRYLVETIQISRPSYSKNVIINILTCATQGFLTVFSGMPGCGKTSICNIVAKVLGLNNYDDVDSAMKETSRYIPVSVERGWTSKRDFIGYFNPLTKMFEESNKKVFEGLKLLDLEKKQGYNKWPFIILLDEANLSPMEYYWADFMNVCDDQGDNSVINLGNENLFQIPETLHFLATINNDHTTETLSPRLIDRAWIITLPKNTTAQYNNEIPQDRIRNISWNDICRVFTVSGYDKKSFDREIQSIYDGVKDRLLKQGLYVSPRVDIAIHKYWIVASKLMEEDEYGNSSSIIALDYAIAQKILPKLIGSSEEYEVWLEEFKNYCDNKGLTYSAELLNSIINRGNRQMKYYQFFN